MSFEGLLILAWMFTLTASSTFSPSPYVDVCPGGVVEFTCTVEDDDTSEATFWRIDETSIECNLGHNSAPLNRSCGPFQLTLNPPVENSYTSVLRKRNVSVALNNTEVQCLGPSFTTVVGSSTLRIIAPPVAPSFLPLSPSDFTDQDSGLQVTLRWTAPVVYPQPSDAAVSRYVITSDQAGTCAHVQGGCVVSPSGPGFSQREYTLDNLPLSQDYTFTVRADNCEMGDNFQTGMASDGLVLSLQLPAMPACGSVPVYDTNDQLVGIETYWTAVVAPVSEVAPNVSGDVANYVLRVAEVAQSTEVLDPSEVCGVSGCSYCVINTFAGDSGQYTVLLQARNIVGTGLQQECGTLGYENNLLKVSVDMSVPEGQLQCTFLSGFTGSARCRIEYFLQTISGIVESTEFGSEGDTVPVDLDLLLNAEYTYTATLVDASAGTTPVVVMGTFTTQCACNGTVNNATNDNCGENTVARDSNTSVVITAATVSAVVAFIIGALLGGLTHLCYPTKKKTSQITLETARKASRYESNELQAIEELPQDSVCVESSPDDVEYANVQPIHRDAIELNANLAYRNLRRQN